MLCPSITSTTFLPQQLLESRGVDIRGCTEKGDLINKLLVVEPAIDSGGGGGGGGGTDVGCAKCGGKEKLKSCARCKAVKVIVVCMRICV